VNHKKPQEVQHNQGSFLVIFETCDYLHERIGDRH